MAKFTKLLKPHHLAIVSGKMTVSPPAPPLPSRACFPARKLTARALKQVLQRAVFEHNILATSNIYNNISLAELAVLLDTKPEAAESLACKMIEEGRMKASIDQVESLIQFEDSYAPPIFPFSLRCAKTDAASQKPIRFTCGTTRFSISATPSTP